MIKFTNLDYIRLGLQTRAMNVEQYSLVHHSLCICEQLGYALLYPYLSARESFIQSKILFFAFQFHFLCNFNNFVICLLISIKQASLSQFTSLGQLLLIMILL